ncbi:bifunctional metallophosphatase/5'-nucleotidase [Robertkochia flava]|uniref:bifunctional metallophosphatase/5'-nucleotidase n=1 Tax=Robertkochia flava TaxID=3447986 RepID=UPI001CCEBD55|nr:metallophosphatase [Robertkochia marina]
MKRRLFIQKTLAGTLFLGTSGLAWEGCTPARAKNHITILHTNDVHSHIDPFPADHARNPNMGGVARRASLIEQIRNENPNTLLLDAGDIFQGTPYFNFYGGEIEFKLMSKLGYDAATIGNHDFDNGIEGLYAQMPNAKFSFVSANYDFSNTVMNGLVKPYQIFERDEVKIGVFGLGIELAGLVNKKQYKETVYLDPVEICEDMCRELKDEQGCDLIICLSHLGYQYDSDKVSDRVLAAKSKDLDLIIGGHTHTFMDKPQVVNNREDQPVLINQVGCFGLYLGRIDFYFDHKETRGEGVIISV